MMKRGFDIFFSTLGLLFLSPLLLLVGVLVKLQDGGPIFFAQERVGLSGRIFRMLKFRTMVINAEAQGGQLTVGADRRITRLGRLLRASKLDEFPQLWNVICGEMSLVGPRPEVPRYVDLYTETERAVLQYKPGITDPASFAFFNEAELLAKAKDPQAFYQNFVAREKIRINLEYAKKGSLLTDIVLIVATLLRSLGLHLNIFAWLAIRPPQLDMPK